MNDQNARSQTTVPRPVMLWVCGWMVWGGFVLGWIARMVNHG